MLLAGHAQQQASRRFLLAIGKIRGKAIEAARAYSPLARIFLMAADARGRGHGGRKIIALKTSKEAPRTFA